MTNYTKNCKILNELKQPNQYTQVSYRFCIIYNTPMYRVRIYGGIYRVHINYRRILQNHIFTNTEHKYMMLLPFERGMFAVS